jgi:hypothetical protein
MSAKSFLACLLRFPGEKTEDVLDRFFKYYDYGAEYAKTPLAKVIEEQAHAGIALTPRMVKEIAGISVSVDGLSPEAIDLYHGKLDEERRRKVARNVGQRLLSIASGRSDEDLETVIADVDVEEEQKPAAMDLPTHSAVGMKMFRDRAEELASGKPRIAFPWNVVNEAVPFIYQDDMILLSGMSKVGKSSAAHQLALYNASRLNVVYFHNEDNPLKVFLRRIAQYQLARDPNPLRSGGPLNMGTLDYRELLNHNVKNSKLMEQVEEENAFILNKIGNRLTYVYCSGWTADQIVSEWRKAKRRGKVDLVIIDYLNKIESYTKARTIGTMAGAMEYNVELFKREAGRKNAMTPCVLVQQENEDGTVRDTRSSYIKSQLHISVTRDVDESGMQVTGRIKVLRANDGRTGNFPAQFYPGYMVWIA